MSSNDQSDGPILGRPNFLSMSSEEFEVLYQVTKDLHSVPENLLREEVGLRLEDALRLRQVARSIRDHLEEAPRVRIRLGEDASSVAVSPPAVVTIVKGGAGPVKEIQGTMPARLVARWHALTEAVISSLGPRELFLRTGYDEEEIRRATQNVALDS